MRQQHFRFVHRVFMQQRAWNGCWNRAAAQCAFAGRSIPPSARILSRRRSWPGWARRGGLRCRRSGATGGERRSVRRRRGRAFRRIGSTIWCVRGGDGVLHTASRTARTGGRASPHGSGSTRIMRPRRALPSRCTGVVTADQGTISNVKLVVTQTQRPSDWIAF